VSDTQRRHGLTFVFVMVIINMLGVGLAWPILPKLVQELMGGTISEAAFSFAFLTLSYALSQFLFSPFLGALSDRFGRRPILLLAALGLAFDHLLVAFAPTVGIIILLRAIGGMFGATISTANAYVTDVSTPETRARNFGMIGAAFGIGFVIGPLIGGFLGAIDLRYPFFAAAGLAFIQFVYGYFFLPESLPKTTRSAVNLKQANPLGGILAMGKFPAILPLLLCFLLISISQRGLESTWILYTDFRFGWDVRAGSWSLAYVGLVSALVQGGLVRAVVPKLGELRTVILGFSIATLAALAFSFTENGLLAIPVVGFYVLGYDLAGPPLRSIISGPVPAHRQGLLQGVMASLNGLAVIIGPFVAGLVLADVSGPSPLIPVVGAWYLFGTLMLLFTLCVVITIGNTIAEAKPTEAE
jgi:DHA1 family tetracycline resistance protein-like MFS transporter